MGRPPIGKKAMSTGQRQRRYWERVLRASATPAETAERRRVAELESKLAAAHQELHNEKRLTKLAEDAAAEIKARNAELEAEIARLKAGIRGSSNRPQSRGPSRIDGSKSAGHGNPQGKTRGSQTGARQPSSQPSRSPPTR